MLGLWKTAYFYLEGTQFMIFEDDKTHTPNERVDLSGCIVDGVWPNDGLYSFVLRHIPNELHYQLSSFTYDDATEWMSKLKQATMLADYESILGNIDNHQQIEKSQLNSTILNSQTEKNIPPIVKTQLEHYSKLQSEHWNVIKVLKNMKLLEIKSMDRITLKGELILHGKLSQIALAIREGQEHIDLFNPMNQQKDNNHSTYWQFDYKGIPYNLCSSYQKYHIQRQDYFILTKIPIATKEKHDLNMILNVIHIVQDDQKCYCNYVVSAKKLSNHSIVRRFLKETIINLSVLQSELDMIVYNISDSSRIKSIPSLRTNSLQDEIQQQHDDSPFTMGDRASYIDVNDPNDPAFKYDQKHNRLLNQTEEQMNALIALRRKVMHLKLNDQALIRFLLARNYNVEESELMILKCAEWRRVNNINARHMSEFPQFINENLHVILGKSKWGHPILYTLVINADVNKFGTTPNITEALYHQFYQGFLEDGIRQMRGNVDQYIVIIDCFGLANKCFSLSVMKTQFYQTFNFYPERQYKIFVLQTNFLTRTFYAILKPFLPARTVEKIIFVGQNSNDIQQRLLDDLDLETIPQKYGGNNPLVV